MKYCVFCDVDGTLTVPNTMLSFYRWLFYHPTQSWKEQIKAKAHELKIELQRKLGVSREKLNETYYQIFKDRSVEWVEKKALEWYSQLDPKSFFRQEMIQELTRHAENGACIVLVSGAFDVCLKNMGRDLPVDHLLCAELEIVQGRFSGKIAGHPVIGKNKKNVIEHFILKNSQFNLKDCYAYGDHWSDRFMLEAVGHPKIVKGDPTLENIAKEQGWEIVA